MASTRRRRAPDEVRAQALSAAREILLTQGAASVTLKGVAARLGMAHGNVTYHFGSAGGLQAALAELIILDTITAVEAELVEFRSGRATLDKVVATVFDAFATGGAGALIAWLCASGEQARVTPFCDAIAEMAERLHADDPAASASDRASALILLVILPALGAALIGAGLTSAMNMPSLAPRLIVEEQLATLMRPPTHQDQ